MGGSGLTLLEDSDRLESNQEKIQKIAAVSFRSQKRECEGYEERVKGNGNS